MIKQEIAILVSHRIDLDSSVVRNPLYINVRCGAVFDDRKNINIIGDNTGDNISSKRNSFCEYTVQYWAWKNIDAEYYGLCHYRRYLSFSNKYYDCKESHGFAVEEKLNHFSAYKYGLLNYRKMKKEIKNYDLITSHEYPVSNLPFYPKPTNEMDVWLNHPENLLSKYEIDILLKIIKDKYPNYYNYALEFMNLNVHRGFNCFIMRKDLFKEMCKFEFDVLFEIEKLIKTNNYSGKKERVIGYLGEILYGIYIYMIKKENVYKIKETQIILFKNTNRKGDMMYYKIKLRQLIKKMLYNILPSYRVTLRTEKRMVEIQRDLKNIQTQLKAIDNLNKIHFWLSKPLFTENINEVKKQFWLSYPNATGNLRFLQKGNTFLLENLKRICDDIDVKFWLHGGSLVGAIRHGGPVPWDDDIDIAMMRRDFKKLKEYLKSNDEFEILEYYYTVLLCRSYRFRKKSFEGNFFVDIFIYDDYDCEDENILEEWKKLRTFKIGFKSQWRDFVNKEKFIPQNNCIDDRPELKSNIDKLIDAYIEKIKGSEDSQYIVWGIDNNYENNTRFAWHNGRIFRKSDIFPLKKATYEGEEYLIPCNFEKYIFAEYGINYLEMPNNMGVSMHINNYFKNKDIENLYYKLIKQNGKN